MLIYLWSHYYIVIGAREITKYIFEKIAIFKYRFRAFIPWQCSDEPPLKPHHQPECWYINYVAQYLLALTRIIKVRCAAYHQKLCKQRKCWMWFSQFIILHTKWWIDQNNMKLRSLWNIFNQFNQIKRQLYFFFFYKQLSQFY